MKTGERRMVRHLITPTKIDNSENPQAAKIRRMRSQ